MKLKITFDKLVSPEADVYEIILEGCKVKIESLECFHGYDKYTQRRILIDALLLAYDDGGIVIDVPDSDIPAVDRS